MSETVSLADLSSFSFHKNPVLVVENFWSPEERQFFREGMGQAKWRSLSDLPKVKEDFPNAGNWAKLRSAGTKGSDCFRAYSCPAFRHTWSPFRISQAGTWVSTIIHTRLEIAY